MREIRTYGSEGGEAPQGAFPTLIQVQRSGFLFAIAKLELGDPKCSALIKLFPFKNFKD